MKIRSERFLFVLVFVAVYFVWKSTTILVTNDEDEKERQKQQQRGITTIHGIKLRKNININNNNHHEEDQSSSYFVLHIGPPKTATTTIQCGLHHLSGTLATSDSFYFVGKTCPQIGEKIMANNETAIDGHHLLMGLNDANPSSRGYIGLKARMDHHLSHNHNMIYSNEGFANHMVDQNSTWECLKDLFVGWNVRIIIGYRRYFEWIRSLYYQQFLHSKKYKINWPNQGKGKPHPSFLEYLDYHLHRWETDDLSVDGGHSAPAYGHHLSLSTYKKFSPHFDDVRFFNLYGTDRDLVTNFVCGMLPVAGNTCDILRSNMATTTTTAERRKEGPTTDSQGLVLRTSKSFDAQRISEAAFERGYITISSPKKRVVELVEQKIQETKIASNPKFLTCPSASLEARFLNASISFEEEVLSISHPHLSTEELENAKATHVKMFQIAKAEQKFCEVDPDVLLQDKDWVQFLSQIGDATS